MRIISREAMDVMRQQLEGAMLDELDLRIAQELIADVHQSSRQIGKKLNAPHPTVQRRIKRLLKNHILHVIALPNPEALGYQVWAIIGIVVKAGFSRRVAESLLKYPFCYVIAETMGPYDVIATARFKTIDELHEFVAIEMTKNEGIEKVQPHLLVKPHRYYDFRWLFNTKEDLP